MNPTKIPNTADMTMIGAIEKTPVFETNIIIGIAVNSATTRPLSQPFNPITI